MWQFLVDLFGRLQLLVTAKYQIDQMIYSTFHIVGAKYPVAVLDLDTYYLKSDHHRTSITSLVGTNVTVKSVHALQKSVQVRRGHRKRCHYIHHSVGESW